MDPITAAMLASAATAAIGGGLSYFGQQSANDSNADLSRSQTDFQRQSAHEAMAFNYDQSQRAMNYGERMSNTSWQRGVADMKAAGINPLLAFSKGGASTPVGIGGGGISASGAAIPKQNVFGGVPASISSAAGMLKMGADIKQAQATTDYIKQQKSTSHAQEIQTKANTANTRTALPGLLKEKAIDESKFGTVMKYLGRLNPFGSSASSLIASLGKAFK